MTPLSAASTRLQSLFQEHRGDTLLNAPVYRLFSMFWMVVYCTAIGQDYFGASINNTAFYLSESVLFNTFWLVFIPVGFIIVLIIQKGIFPASKASLKWVEAIILSLMLASIHLVGFSLFITVISEATGIHSFGFVRMLNETFTEDFYLAFSLYGLLLFILWVIFNPIPGTPRQNQPSYIDTLTIRKGKTLVPVNVSQIYWIDTESPYIAIHTADDTYLHASSLTRIMKKLDPGKFARIHRSAIININRIDELTSRLNGDYDVTLESGAVVRMSRNYSQQVKKLLI